MDQLEKYRTSVHGLRNAKGDAKVAECASCHGSHDILAHTDANSHVYPVNLPGTCARCHSDPEYMKEYKIPTDQYQKFAAQRPWGRVAAEERCRRPRLQQLSRQPRRHAPRASSQSPRSAGRATP